jgi:hypothetical protein
MHEIDTDRSCHSKRDSSSIDASSMLRCHPRIKSKVNRQTKRSIDTTNTHATCKNPDTETTHRNRINLSFHYIRSLEPPIRLTLSCLVMTSSDLIRRIVRLIVRLNILVRPMRILDIRDLKEPIRIGAAHPQSRADTLAVLLLALEADGLDFVFLPCFVPGERSVVSVTGFGLKRVRETYNMLEAWLGSLPAATIQAKRAVRRRRIVRYLMFSFGGNSGFVFWGFGEMVLGPGDV